MLLINNYKIQKNLFCIFDKKNLKLDNIAKKNGEKERNFKREVWKLVRNKIKMLSEKNELFLYLCSIQVP